MTNYKINELKLQSRAILPGLTQPEYDYLDSTFDLIFSIGKEEGLQVAIDNVKDVLAKSK